MSPSSFLVRLSRLLRGNISEKPYSYRNVYPPPSLSFPPHISNYTYRPFMPPPPPICIHTPTSTPPISLSISLPNNGWKKKSIPYLYRNYLLVGVGLDLFQPKMSHMFSFYGMYRNLFPYCRNSTNSPAIMDWVGCSHLGTGIFRNFFSNAVPNLLQNDSTLYVFALLMG